MKLHKDAQKLVQSAPKTITLERLALTEYHAEIVHGPSADDGSERFYAEVYRGGKGLEPGESIGALVWMDDQIWPSRRDAIERAKAFIARHWPQRGRRHFDIGARGA